MQIRGHRTGGGTGRVRQRAEQRQQHEEAEDRPGGQQPWDGLAERGPTAIGRGAGHRVIVAGGSGAGRAIRGSSEGEVHPVPGPELTGLRARLTGFGRRPVDWFRETFPGGSSAGSDHAREPLSGTLSAAPSPSRPSPGHRPFEFPGLGGNSTRPAHDLSNAAPSGRGSSSTGAR
ncbi:hypothetical protein Scani_43190 [Streptomyces caniferus]|uniref:Uncharacterized protein n=1 Tax=Streptomyces caniferus TaxID=285557 RepID=A0A640SCB3_9ACTN|nr:hypothetical protein Scani_43190 [Streptomyces caniferus]